MTKHLLQNLFILL